MLLGHQVHLNSEHFLSQILVCIEQDAVATGAEVMGQVHRSVALALGRTISSRSARKKQLSFGPVASPGQRPAHSTAVSQALNQLLSDQQSLISKLYCSIVANIVRSPNKDDAELACFRSPSSIARTNLKTPPGLQDVHIHSIYKLERFRAILSVADCGVPRVK